MVTFFYLGVYVGAAGAGGCSQRRARMSWRGWLSPSGGHGDTPAYPEQRSSDWSMCQMEACDWSLPGAGGRAESSGHCQPLDV